MIKELEAMIEARENKLSAMTKAIRLTKRTETFDQLSIDIEILTAEIKVLKEAIHRIQLLEEMGMINEDS